MSLFVSSDSVRIGYGTLCLRHCQPDSQHFLQDDNVWFVLLNLVLTYAYGCSLLYTVNARKTLTKGLHSVVWSDEMSGAKLKPTQGTGSVS
ncbi:hypothetical protein M422DRAFT_28687 [Sphaerobolus stellatus SS14]|uniref:Uncharacterized protein n=1 Tax=Sphaerobolus stellatus (strain SS14) TaxID=990650 RepID=A0A0C9UW39_SPHS4|nr:hypothetical protein M422DRAFT_28687 [Sphaerobolus stellatus SS14]